MLAKVAELADALDSGSSGVTLVGVQVPSFAQAAESLGKVGPGEVAKETAGESLPPRLPPQRGGTSGDPSDVAAPADPIETALGDALTKASAAGEWSLVAQLARELEARRAARAGAVDLAAERRRRDRG